MIDTKNPGMASKPDTCGTCKWWESWPNQDQSDPIAIGDCMKPGPFVVPKSIRLKDRIEMYENEGFGCPCYADKEKSAPEGRDCLDCGSFVLLGEHCPVCGLGRDSE